MAKKPHKSTEIEDVLESSEASSIAVLKGQKVKKLLRHFNPAATRLSKIGILTPQQAEEQNTKKAVELCIIRIFAAAVLEDLESYDENTLNLRALCTLKTVPKSDVNAAIEEIIDAAENAPRLNQ
ncbi:MAG: hypothetical protein KDI46_02310 [Alphaproteobacteria bacterium]|nr:hypothetical protein [Alphaproteobacteria bacterium]